MVSKKIWVMATIVMVYASQANALQPINTYLKSTYENEPSYKGFFTAMDSLKSRCDVCHIPGADKKAKGHGLNDFGEAYHKVFDDKSFRDAHKSKDKEAAAKHFKEAWEKAIKEKNADGVVFGDLIKDGKLPGKNE